MFAPKNWAIGIVIDGDIFRSPPEELGKTVRQKNAHCGTKRRRPVLWCATRRGGSIQRADEPTHLAGRQQDIEHRACITGTQHYLPFRVLPWGPCPYDAPDLRGDHASLFI